MKKMGEKGGGGVGRGRRRRRRKRKQGERKPSVPSPVFRA